jgi:hypothetical protein
LLGWLPGLADPEPLLHKRKLMSVWHMLIKSMEMQKYQVDQVLLQQRREMAAQGHELSDEEMRESALH